MRPRVRPGIRLQAPESETIYYIFVLDEERRLLGVLSLRQLIVAGRHVMIRDLMETQFVSRHGGLPPQSHQAAYERALR